MRTLVLLLLLVVAPIILISQSLNVFPRGDIYATTSSIYAINTNPANLGKNLKSRVEYQIPVLSGAGFISSTGLSSSRLRNIFFNRNERIEDSEQNDISSFFVNEQTDLATNWSFLSIAFNTSKNGRLGINVSSNVAGSFKVNEPTADLIFNGSESVYAFEIFETISAGNVQESLTAFTNGTSVSLNSGTNFDFSYGQLIKKSKNANHYIGFGLRYRLYSLDVNLQSNEGEFSAYSTYLNDDEDFDILGFGRPNTILKNLFGDNGYGIFLNAGYSVETNKGLNFSLAIRNGGYSSIKASNLIFNDNLVINILESIQSVDILSEIPDYLLSGGLFEVAESKRVREFSLPFIVASISQTFLNKRLLLGLDATSRKDFKFVTDVNLVDNKKSNLGIYTGMVVNLTSSNILLWNIPTGFRFSRDFKRVNFGISWSTYVLGYFNQKRPIINGRLGIHLAHLKK